MENDFLCLSRRLKKYVCPFYDSCKCRDMCGLKFSKLTRTMNGNYKVFIEYMEEILENNIPSKFSNFRHSLPWMNRNLTRIIRKKVRRFKKSKKSGMNEDRTRYLDIEHVVKRELWDVERVYVNEILQNCLESGNNKPFWKYVK